MADYEAIALIGVELAIARLRTKHRVKAFEHDSPDSEEFDAKTGKQLWTYEERPIDGFDPVKNQLVGYRVIRGTDDDRYWAAAFVIDGPWSNGGDDAAMLALPDNHLRSIRSEMRDKLQPLGLWVERDFGLWTVLYRSY